MRSLSFGCLAGLALGTSLGFLSFAKTASAEQLVVNGGFETGDFTGWTLSGNPSLIEVSSSDPHSGTYAANVSTLINRFGTYSFLSQDLATTDFASSTYDLSFSIANDSDGTSLGGGDGSGVLTEFTVSWGGSTLLDLINEGPFDYRTYNFPGLTASSATTNLQFGFKQLGAFWHLDDPGVIVPEPSSLILTALGLFGITVSGWRRQRDASGTPRRCTSSRKLFGE